MRCSFVRCLCRNRSRWFRSRRFRGNPAIRNSQWRYQTWSIGVAILVGAPTGMRPNHYGEHAEFRLPNSGLRVSYSTRYYRFAADADPAVFPDQSIEPTWTAFREGRDPVMEWIFSR